MLSRLPRSISHRRSRGFTLIETLIAMLIGSILLLASARLLPALQYAILRQARSEVLREDLWQVAFTIGKQLQRAGYCKGDCAGQGLYLQADGTCLIVQWDANLNGYWETAPSALAEQTGYRLHNKSVETLRGATHCQGKGWEKMTDPAQLKIQQFHVERQSRPGLPPLLHIRLSASQPARKRLIQLQHTVVGYNL